MCIRDSHYSVDDKCKAVHIYLETWEEGRLVRTEEKQVPIVTGENSEGEITVSFGNDSARLNQVRAVNWKLGMTEHRQLKHTEWKDGIPGNREFSGMRTDFRDQHLEDVYKRQEEQSAQQTGKKLWEPGQKGIADCSVPVRADVCSEYYPDSGQ